jgi:hypothetical protein
VHAEWVEAELCKEEQQKRAEWSESVVVGRREFVERVANELGAQARHRKVDALDEDIHTLREPGAPYATRFGCKIGLLSHHAASFSRSSFV